MPALLVVLPLVGACLAPIENPEVASQSFDCPHGLDPEEQTLTDRRGEALQPRLQQAANWHAHVGNTAPSHRRRMRGDLASSARTTEVPPVAQEEADAPQTAREVE